MSAPLSTTSSAIAQGSAEHRRERRMSGGGSAPIADNARSVRSAAPSAIAALATRTPIALTLTSTRTTSPALEPKACAPMACAAPASGAVPQTVERSLA